MSLPTASTPGYGVMRGFVGCLDVIEFLTVAEELGRVRGLIRSELDIVQLTGDADRSAGVHSLGSAFDVKQRSEGWVRVFREMGAAFWPREGPAWAGNEHGHGVIRCDHDDRSAYQHLAYRRGYNGLGQGWYEGQYLWGYGAKDTLWRPSTIRSTAQGIAWARSRIEEESLPTAQEIAAEVWKRAPWPGQSGMPGSSIPNNIGWQSVWAQETLSIVKGLAAKAGVDVDESAIASQLLAGLGPMIRQAVMDAVPFPDDDPLAERLADEVVAKLGAKLSGTETV